MIDNFKTEAFVNGIREPDIKLAICSTYKPTFAETVGYALAPETAGMIYSSQVSKVQKWNSWRKRNVFQINLKK